MTTPSPAAMLAHAKDVLAKAEEVMKRNPEPWRPYLTIHGDPFVVTDSDSGQYPIICRVETSSPEYGKPYMESICLAHAALPDFLASVRKEVWDINNLTERQMISGNVEIVAHYGAEIVSRTKAICARLAPLALALNIAAPSAEGEG